MSIAVVLLLICQLSVECRHDVDSCLLLQRSQTIRSLYLGSCKIGSHAGRLLLEGVKVRSGELCLLSVDELLNLEPFVCLFVLVHSSTTLWRNWRSAPMD